MTASPTEGDFLDLSINDNTHHALNLTNVGRFLTTKTVHFKAITTILTAAWNLGNSVLFCTFQNLHDRNHTLGSKKALPNLLPWPPNLNWEELDFTKCPM